MADTKLKISGLHTSANQLSSVPDGALEIAENIDILYNNIAQPRRGVEKATTDGFTTTADRADRIYFYQDYLFSHHGNVFGADELSYYNSGWQSLGSFSAPTGRKMQFIQAAKSMFFSTDTGIKKMSAYNSTPIASGVPKALNLSLDSLFNGTINWLANGDTVAYRVVWAITDDNNNLITGAPSGRLEVTNTAGAARDVKLDIYIPDGITEDHFYQIYRSAAVTGTPNDELQLVYEGFPTAGQITAGVIDAAHDITPDGLRGASLYTNATQEGLVYQNEQPPLAKDMALFQDCLFLSNTTDKHRYNLTLLSAATLANNDTITIAGVAYTAKDAGETVASGFFKRFTTGTATQNIKDTAVSLVNVINQYASNTFVYAYYLSSDTDVPGKILLEERGVGGSAFTIITSNPSAWSPAGIPTSGSTEVSLNDSSSNKLVWSKPFQPEHFPLVNSVNVGSSNYEIKKIIGLKDFLIIFKEDGIYRLSGYYPNFNVELLDSSAILIGHETPVIVNNSIFALTDIGVVQISEGVNLVSGPINQEISQLINTLGAEIEVSAFGVSYEVEKKYYLFLPELSTDTTPTFAYVYNLLTDSWVKHLIPATCGAIGNKTLYLGDNDSHYIFKERKTYSFLDYADYNFDTTITSINSLVLGISSGVDNINTGDVIWQSATIFANVLSVDTINSTVTIDRDPGLSVASCEILSSIPVKVGWTVSTAPDVMVSKQYSSVVAYCDEAFTGTAYIGFTTDASFYEEEVTIAGIGNGNWGMSVWGGSVWGSIPLSKQFRNWIPRAKQRASQMKVYFRQSYGYSAFKLSGVSLIAKAGDERNERS